MSRLTRIFTRRRTVLALAATALATTSVALAFWVASGSGSASGSVGTLAAPTGAAASSPTGSSTVSVSWTASAAVDGISPTGYYVRRWSGSTPAVAGGTCGSPASPVNQTSCTDSSVPDGSYTYTVVAVYHSWTAESGHSGAVTVAHNTTPPVTTLTSAPASPEGSNNWFTRASVGFTLSATSPGSGVAETLYAIDGGPQHTYSGEVTINTQGDHTVTYWSVDKEGNEESHKTTHLKLDNVAPATTIALEPSSPNGSNGWYSTSPTFTLGASDASSGVASTHYRIDSGTEQTYTGSAVSVPEGQHTVSYWSVDNAGNTETAHTTATIKVDTTKPADALSLGTASNAFLNGSTLYFNSGVSGSFTLINTVTDASSGPASATFPLLSASKWTHAAQTVSTPSGGPYTSSTYSWTSGAGTPSGAEATFTSKDNAGNSSSGTALTFSADTTAPTGGALTVNGTVATAGGSTSTSTSTAFAVGSRTDYTETQSASQSGLASSTLTIQSETFTNDTCGAPGSGGAYTAPTAISGTSNPPIATGFCYLYTLTGTDNVGNTASVKTTVEVDSALPTNALSLGTSSNAFLNGTTLYFNSGVGGSFTLVNTVSDASSGPASATFPLVSASKWTHAAQTVSTPAGGPYTSSTYSWTSSAGTPSGAEATFTSKDNFGNTSANTVLTFTPDATAPTAGAVSVNGTAATGAGSTSTSTETGFAIGSRSDYTETQSPSQSGLASSTLTIQSETLTGNTCGAPGSGGKYTSATTVSGTNNPAIETGFCYLYTLTGTDNVGNAASVKSTVKVDATGPSSPTVTLSAATGNTFISGTTVFINPQAGKEGSFKAAGSSSDAQTGVTSIALPSLTGFSEGGGTLSSPFETKYKWAGAVGASGAQSATATNGVGLTTTNTSAFTVTADTTAPSGGSVSVPERVKTASVTVTFSAGTDTGSGINTASAELLRAEATYTGSSDSCGSFGSFAKLGSAGPTSPATDATVVTSKCYEYEYKVSDNVGNSLTYGPSEPVKVNTAGPALTGISSTNGNAILETGDTLTLTFSDLLNASSIPATGTIVQAKTGEGAKATIAITGITGGTEGWSTGVSAGYQTKGTSAEFNETASTSGNTVKVTVGSKVTGTTPIAGATGTATGTVNPAVKDVFENAASAGTFSISAKFW